MADLRKIKEIISLYEEGYRIDAICGKVDCNSRDLYSVLALTGVKHRRPQKDNPIHAEIIRLYRTGLPAIEVASEIGCHFHTVRRVVNRAGLARPRHQKRKTERNKEIVRLREGGETLQGIGIRFGVSRERVRQVLFSEGRADLCARSSTLSTKPCGICGGGMTDARSVLALRDTCSLECRQEKARRKGVSIRWPKVEKVLELRAAGKTWRECGETVYHANGANCQTSRSVVEVKTFARNLGVDIGWAFPGAVGRTIAAPDGWKTEIRSAMAEKGIRDSGGRQ